MNFHTQQMIHAYAYQGILTDCSLQLVFNLESLEYSIFKIPV